MHRWLLRDLVQELGGVDNYPPVVIKLRAVAAQHQRAEAQTVSEKLAAAMDLLLSEDYA